MGKGKINLEELFVNNFNCYAEFGLKLQCIDEQPALTKDKFKELCLEFGKQLLELATENAKIDWLRNGVCGISEQSILDTIKQIES